MSICSVWKVTEKASNYLLHNPTALLSLMKNEAKLNKSVSHYLHKGLLCGAFFCLVLSQILVPAQGMDPRSSLRIGLELVNNHKDNEALGYLNTGLQFHGNTPNDLIMHAKAAIITHSYEESLADCDKILELDPSMKYEVAAIRLEAHKKLGLLDKAKEDEAIVRSTPVNGHMWPAPPTPAASSFDKAISQHPRDPKVYLARAKYYEYKNPAKAIADYTMVLILQPRNADCLVHRAKLYSKMHYYQKALQDISKVLALKLKTSETFNDPL
ncbi:MAG: hypothetical protein K2X81_20380, partial [Candidatus Obscuribacterales bacterium]|nr:hypothetical protein [Candidatus Obscuribacterales bacterium]